MSEIDMIVLDDPMCPKVFDNVDDYNRHVAVVNGVRRKPKTSAAILAMAMGLAGVSPDALMPNAPVRDWKHDDTRVNAALTKRMRKQAKRLANQG